jgi:prolipoprotein diacylglyceryltransferase
VIFHVWGVSIHAHEVMELCGYFAGSQLFIFLRKKFPGPKLGDERGLWIIVGCLLGAVIGSKSLALIESIHQYAAMAQTDPSAWLGGKTIAGGLAGGWLGVEIAKRLTGLRQSTGDRFVFPILLGLSIGRIGCFLEGLPDHTYGIATSLPWGVDFGDGIRRHPTQLYEIVFCLTLAIALLIYARQRGVFAHSPSPGTPGEGRGEGDATRESRLEIGDSREGNLPSCSTFNNLPSRASDPHPNPLPEYRARGQFEKDLYQPGQLFRLMMLGYFSWRFLVEFIKPRETYFGLSPIQITSLIVVIVSVCLLIRGKRKVIPISE